MMANHGEFRRTHIPPHAEIEHILALRTMMAIGAGIASQPTGEKDVITWRNTANLAQKDWFQELVNDASSIDGGNYTENEFNAIKLIKLNDLHSINLKKFGINNVYNKGDYVLSKSSKNDNYDSIYIAKMFNVDEKPYLNSDNWVKGDLKSVISEIIQNLSDDEKNKWNNNYSYENYIAQRGIAMGKDESTRSSKLSTKNVLTQNQKLYNVLYRNEELRLKFIESINHYNIDWLQGTNYLGEHSSSIFSDLERKNVDIVELIINMIKIVTNGMWYSCKCWNQIKSEACLVRIQEDGTNIQFGIYNTGLDVIIKLFLAHIYDTNQELMKNYEIYKEYKYSESLQLNINKIYNDGERNTEGKGKGGNMWDGTSYQGDDGVMFHYLEGSPNRNYTMDPPEFDWLQSIFKDTTYADAYEHIKSNVTYVLKKICKNLNNHIHDRGYFQAKNDGI